MNLIHKAKVWTRGPALADPGIIPASVPQPTAGRSGPPWLPAMPGKNLHKQRIREDTGCSIIAISDERTVINPNPNRILDARDELILLGTTDAERKFADKYQSA